MEGWRPHGFSTLSTFFVAADGFRTAMIHSRFDHQAWRMGSDRRGLREPSPALRDHRCNGAHVDSASPPPPTPSRYSRRIVPWL